MLKNASNYNFPCHFWFPLSLEVGAFQIIFMEVKFIGFHSFFLLSWKPSTLLSLHSHKQKRTQPNIARATLHSRTIIKKCLVILIFAEFWAHKSPAYSSLGSYSIGGRFNSSFYLPVCFKRLITL